MLDYLAILAVFTMGEKGKEVKTSSAKDAKYGFGQLIDLTRTAPAAVSKHGRPLVVVVAVEEFERLQGLETPAGGGRTSRNSRGSNSEKNA
jgi:prevent-host-death family protein